MESKGVSEAGQKARKFVYRPKYVKAASDAVYEHMPAVVEGVIGQAEKGNLAAAKFLFEFAGVQELKAKMKRPAKKEKAEPKKEWSLEEYVKNSSQ